MEKKSIFILFFCFYNTISSAQTDSKILTYNEYIANILMFHPIAKQADIKLRRAIAEFFTAEGNLDPTLEASLNEKNFDDKLYYRKFNAKVVVPTQYGLDFVAGYENTTGNFLNPENSTDRFGLWHLGVEVNILQGLIINERSIAFDQAEIFQDLAVSERAILINKLLYSASLSYLIWQEFVAFEAVLLENKILAEQYYRDTKATYLGGEKTAMDTLEAYILLQDTENLIQKNGIRLLKAKQDIENYIWLDHLPVGLQANTQPEDYQNKIFQFATDRDINNSLAKHPELLEKINKQSYLETAQKLKREKLKPKLKLKYNPLIGMSDDGNVYNFTNYKLGANLSFPFFRRTERAEIEKGLIKLEEIALDIDNKKNELQNKIESSLEQQANLRAQIALLSKNVAGYKRLLELEGEKFRFGESTFFILNKRQEKYIDGQLKLIDLEIKLQGEYLNYLYYTNNLYRESNDDLITVPKKLKN